MRPLTARRRRATRQVPSQAIYFFLFTVMSVYVLSSADFGTIAATLRTARSSFSEMIFPLSDHEELFRVRIRPEQSREEYAATLIDPFVFRLYIANQMAKEYTYLKDERTSLVVPVIDFPKSRPVPLKELLRLLDSLSYNLVTNGGNTFLGINDDKKLEQIMSRVQRELIRTE